MRIEGIPHILLVAAPAIAVSVTFVACTETSSTGLATNDIRATLYVSVEDDNPSALTGVPEGGAGGGDAGDGGAPESGSFISAELYKDDSITNVVDLGDGDNIYAATNLNPNTPMPRGLPGFYDTADGIDLSKLTDVNFVLTRKTGTSAPSSKVTVAPAIALTAPKQGDMVSVTSGKVTFTWSTPAAGAKVYALMHPCDSFSASGSTSDSSKPDTGSFDVQMSTVPGGQPTVPTCYLARVIRTMTGTPDPAWHSGSTVVADRTFWLTFTATP
jgi:hypothetical protein